MTASLDMVATRAEDAPVPFHDHDWRRRAVFPFDEFEDEPIVVHYEVDGGRAIDAYIADLAARGRAPRTLRQYRATLNSFLDTLPIDAERDLEMVTGVDCQRFIERHRCSTSTRRYLFAVLSAFFRWLHANGKIPSNPVGAVPRPPLGAADETEVEVVIENEHLRALSWGDIRAKEPR